MKKNLLYGCVITMFTGASFLNAQGAEFSSAKNIGAYSTPEPVCFDRNIFNERTDAVPPQLSSAPKNLCLLSEQFNEGLGLFTVINANNDNSTWGWDNATSESGKQGTARYQYSRDFVGDDWLMSPALEMRAGHDYTVEFSFWATRSSYPERMEVKYGKSNTPEGMTFTLMPATETSDEYGTRKVQSFTVTPSEDGTYYFGFHAISVANQYDLYLDDISIRQNLFHGAPGAVTDFTLTAGAKGAQNVNISFRAPEIAADGTRLESIDSIQIVRNDTLIHTLKAPGVGSTVSYDDLNPALFTNRYTVTAYKNDEIGVPATQEVFVGVDIPSKVQNTRYDDSGASLLASWDLVTTGHHNGYINAETITYTIAKAVNDPMTGFYLEEIATTRPKASSFDFKINPNLGEQQFLYYTIFANSEIGSGDYSYIENGRIIGKPYSLPFDENVIGGKLNGTFWHSYTSTPESGGILYLDSDSYDAEAKSGSIGWADGFAGDYLMLGTGKLDIASAEYPTLFFATKSKNGKVTVIAEDSKQNKHVLSEIPVTGNTWTVHKVDLTPVKNDRYVMVYFKMQGTPKILLDDIHILNQYRHNLSIEGSCVSEIKAGEKALMQLEVSNPGAEDAPSFTLKVTADGNVFYSIVEKNALASMASRSYEVEYASTVFDKAKDVKLSAEIIYAKDLVPQNNVAEAVVSVREPVATPLKCVDLNLDGAQARLSWAVPETIVEEKSESFEDYENGTIDNIGTWTLYDGDQSFVMGLGNSLPMPHNNEKYAYMVFDVGLTGYDNIIPGIAPHGGKKVLLSCFGVTESGTNNFADQDNWLISSELPGIQQEISFYAKSLTLQYGKETFQILYSTTDNLTASFQMLSSHTVDDQWTQIRQALPEGTKYFAIRHVTAKDQTYVFMLDDIKYVNTGSSVAGYNVYKNKEFVANTPSTDFLIESYDPSAAYSVSVVYTNNCESRPTAATNQSGVENVPENETERIFDVYTVAGILVKRNATTTNGLIPGIYLLVSNDKCVKKIVR